MRCIRLGGSFVAAVVSVICLAPPAIALPKTTSIQEEYNNRLLNQIGTAWRAVVDSNQGRLAPVAIRVHFHMNDDGSISEIQVAAGRPNDRPDDLLSRLTRKVLTTIKYPPPKDRLKGQLLDFNVRFEVTD